MATVDDIAPAYVGEDRIKITLDLDADETPAAARAFSVQFDYKSCAPEGVVLPLELIFQPGFGKGDGFTRRIFTRQAPTSATFTPPEGGDWLVVLREVGHNRWQGRLIVKVEGDATSRIDV